MANALLPFQDPTPYQIPVVDLKTGLMTEAWQRWHLNQERVIFGVWREQAFDAADFTTRSGLITWNVGAASVTYITIYQQGPLAFVFFRLLATTVSGDIDILRIRIPTLRAAPTNVNASFQNDIIANINPAATELAEAYVVNVSATPSDPVQINIERATGADFPVASPAIRVQGCVCFQCQSVVVP